MKELRIGLAGLGSVGSGVYEILKKDADLITQRTQSKITIVAAASRTKKDFLDAKIRFYDDVLKLANDPEIDVVIEAIGGKTIAKDLIIAAIKNGKKVITANKALLAEDGLEIAKLLEENNGHIAFEAAVAGANPIVKTFREAFAGNEIIEFFGILNGTSNFILSKMLSEKRSYSDVLQEAQSLGYVEADSALDLKGIDAAHKLVILSAIAALAKPQFKETHIEGIDKITLDDMILAHELGYKIKLLAIYRKSKNSIQQAVYPALIAKDKRIANVDGAYNAIATHASNANWNFMIGSGAGSLPTASAITSDLVDIARGNVQIPLFNASLKNLGDATIEDLTQRVGKYFLRLKISKETAKQGDLSQKIFADKIAIAQAHLIDNQDEMICAFITEDTKEKDFMEILNKLDEAQFKEISFLRVEEIAF